MPENIDFNNQTNREPSKRQNEFYVVFHNIKNNDVIRIILYFIAIFSGITLPHIFKTSEPFLYSIIALLIIFVFTIAHTVDNRFKLKLLRLYIWSNAILLNISIYFLLVSFIIPKETRLCDNLQTTWQYYRCDSKDEMIRLQYTCVLGARPLTIDSVKFEIMVCLDQNAKAYYFNTYIEKTGYTVQVCDMCLMPRLLDVLNDIKKTGYVQTQPTGKTVYAKDLIFIKHVYFYYDTWLIPSQQDRIIQLFKEQDMTVELRGIEYVLYRIGHSEKDN